jgi:ATP-dependent protease ClpP protease subunit
LKKSNLIYLKGEFDSAMIKYLKEKIRLIDDFSKEIIIRVNSYGGNGYPMTVMSALVYYMIKYKNCKVVIEIEYAESSSLLFVINFPIRKIIETSEGVIHLPVQSPGKFLSKSRLIDKTNEVIDFFIKQTNLKREEIISLNSNKLTAKQMLDWGIATEIVPEFFSSTA